MRGQRVGDHRRVAADRPGVTPGDHDLLVLPPLDPVPGGDLDRPAMAHVQPLRPARRRPEQEGGEEQEPHCGLLPLRTSRAGPWNWIAAPLSISTNPCESSTPNGPSAWV